MVLARGAYTVRSRSAEGPGPSFDPHCLRRSLTLYAFEVLTICANAFTPYQLNPTAWNWGAKTGFFWAGGCLISIVFTYLCVPETKMRTAAEVDVLFEQRISLRRFAQTKVDLVEAIGGEEIVVKR